jgi:DNA-binding NtrC family response regulator
MPPLDEPAATVLVVEDDDEMLAWVGEVLREEGFVVLAASDVFSALILLLRENADVVVSDWKMPALDGFHLLRSVSRCRPGVPVVLMTAYADAALLRRAMDGGAWSCLAKPFQRRHLLAHVQGALIASRVRAQRSAGPKSAAPPEGRDV